MFTALVLTLTACNRAWDTGGFDSGGSTSDVDCSAYNYVDYYGALGTDYGAKCAYDNGRDMAERGSENDCNGDADCVQCCLTAFEQNYAAACQ